MPPAEATISPKINNARNILKNPPGWLKSLKKYLFFGFTPLLRRVSLLPRFLFYPGLIKLSIIRAESSKALRKSFKKLGSELKLIKTGARIEKLKILGRRQPPEILFLRKKIIKESGRCSGPV